MHSVLEILEESTDPTAFDLISLEDLKFALKIEGSTGEDADLQAAITFQSQLITEYLNRRLAFATALETFTFDRYETLPYQTMAARREALTLSLYPVVDVLEVSTLGSTDGNFDIDPPSGRLWLGSDWSGWSDSVAVTYIGGYNLPDECPKRLQRALIDTIKENMTSGTRDPSIREVQHGDTRIGYFTPTLSTASSGYLSAVVVDLIRPYRRLYVA